jgi:2-aminoadipate transaminase
MVATMDSAGLTALAEKTRTVQGSALRDMLALVMRPDLQSFALGLPAPELLPLADCRAAAAQVLAGDPEALQYHLPCESLKSHLRQLLATRGIDCTEKQIFLTTGAQQATHLVANFLLSPGQQVIMEEVTYEGLHLAIQPLNPEPLIVPTDPETGIDIDAVEEQLERGASPAFIYTITDGHNPLGRSLSVEARIRLVELARRFRTPIVEDDVFGFLNYDGPASPPMRSLDDEWVFYIGSFSKILAPSLRVGWIVVPAALQQALSSLKQASDLDITTLGHLTAAAYLDAGHLPAHLATIRSEYRRRRDAMVRALEANFPSAARWSTPSCGMFVWVELPGEVDTGELLRAAVESESVAFMPGDIFAIPGLPRSRNGMRLNFTHSRVEDIEEGIARLAKVLRKFLHRDFSC